MHHKFCYYRISPSLLQTFSLYQRIQKYMYKSSFYSSTFLKTIFRDECVVDGLRLRVNGVQRSVISHPASHPPFQPRSTLKSTAPFQPSYVCSLFGNLSRRNVNPNMMSNSPSNIVLCFDYKLSSKLSRGIPNSNFPNKFLMPSYNGDYWH